MPDTVKDGWADWENQLNRKTERRRKAAAKRARKGRRIAISVELLLFLAVVSIMALERFGCIPLAVSIPLELIAIVLMSFCAGVFVGAKNNE